MIYLDNHTTAQPSKRVLEAMRPYLEERWGLMSQPHKFGQQLLRDGEEHLAAIYALLGAREPDNVIVTSSGTEAVNHAIMAAYFDLARDAGRNHFICAKTDEAAIIMGLERLQLLGCEVTLLDEVTPEALIEAMTPRTAMVSLCWANGLTGLIHPVAELSTICRERGVWFHLDATHILGKVAFDLDDIAPDLVSFNGDQMHAPKGTGGLFIRSGLRISPLLVGGMEQGGYRAGTLSPALLAGLGAAATEATEFLDEVQMEVAARRNQFEELLNGHIFHKEDHRLPTTTAIGFKGVVADALLYKLNVKRLYTSFGGGNFQPLSSQLDHELRECAVSFTLSRETTNIEEAAKRVNETVAELRALSEGLL